MTTVLMSVKERFAEAILSHGKRYELRRVRPRMPTGTVVWLYATQPCAAVVGQFSVGGITSAAPDDLWRQVGSESGLTRPEFEAYFEGVGVGHAIEVRRPVRTERQRLPRAVRPPQSYRYLNGEDAKTLLEARNRP